MRHFTTYCTKRVLDKKSSVPLGIWDNVHRFEELHPDKLRTVESRIIKTQVAEREVEVQTNVWLFAGNFKEFKKFVKDIYLKQGFGDFFTPGENGFSISESAVALIPVTAETDVLLSQPIMLPRIRSQLSARNFLTFCEDDFPDVDINLSNNSFTLPLSEAIKLAEQIMRIANFHGEENQNPNSGSLHSSNFMSADKTA